MNYLLDLKLSDALLYVMKKMRQINVEMLLKHRCKGSKLDEGKLRLSS